MLSFFDILYIDFNVALIIMVTCDELVIFFLRAKMSANCIICIIICFICYRVDGFILIHDLLFAHQFLSFIILSAYLSSLFIFLRYFITDGIIIIFQLFFPYLFLHQSL